MPKNQLLSILTQLYHNIYQAVPVCGYKVFSWITPGVSKIWQFSVLTYLLYSKYA